MTWTNCSGEGTGTTNRTFACASNAGSNVLVCSFTLDADVAQVSGNELTVDFISQAATLPAWWDMKDPGTCRQLSLGFSTIANANDVVCVDWASGQSTGGIGAYNNSNIDQTSISAALQPQWRRLKIALAVPLSGLQDLVAGTEYFSGNINIGNQKTVGTGACAGCTAPMCIVLNSIKVTTPTPANDVFIGGAGAPGSNIVTWQGAGADCQAVPAKNRTWGQVKALYH